MEISTLSLSRAGARSVHDGEQRNFFIPTFHALFLLSLPSTLIDINEHTCVSVCTNEGKLH